MTWSETDSTLYRDIAAVAVPRRREMLAIMVSLVPFDQNEPFEIVEIGCGEGRLAAALLDCFSKARLTALDGSESMRQLTVARTDQVRDRIRVRPFDLAALDWWDLMRGAGLVVSSLCLHHLNEAKTQYLYKAVADRVSDRGAFLVADLVAPSHVATARVAADAWDWSAKEQADALRRPDLLAKFADAHWNHFRYPDPADTPSAILHHLVWLRHAGFASVDCSWLCAGHAVFCAFKQSSGASSSAGVSYERALAFI